jgi:DNA-binding MarR family transcriptional regulator
MIIHEEDKGFGFLLSDTARLLRRLIDRRLQPFKLTRAQWAILAMLASRDGLSQSELADELEIEKSTVGRLIDHVEANGWIERRPKPSDRRLWLVHLTDRAKPMIGEIMELILETRAEILRGLTVDQQRQLADSLAFVKANLVAALDPPPASPAPNRVAGGPDARHPSNVIE